MVAAESLTEFEHLAEAMAGARGTRNLSLRLETRGLAAERDVLTLGAKLERTAGVTDVILEHCSEHAAVFVVHGTDLSAVFADGEPLDVFTVELNAPTLPSGVLSVVATHDARATARAELRPVPVPDFVDPGSTVPDDAFEAIGARLLSLGATDAVEPPSIATVAAIAAPEALVNADARPGGSVAALDDLVVTVGPFRSFDRVNAFQDAVRALDGVRRVEVGRFYRGTLRLKVEYAGIVSLAHRLRQLEGFGAITITEQGEDTVDVSLPE
jgi:hypothetical protein